MLIWRCWSVRNGVTKAEEALSVEGSVIFLTRYMQSLLSVRQQEVAMDERGKQKPQEKSWRPPPPNALKINADGAFNPESGGAAVGIVIRNDAGQPLLMAGRRLYYCKDAEEAEALACLEGICMGARWADMNIILESDCASVIKLFKEDLNDRA
ncbi:hypothetical protein HU200_039978 [Digitaria exilis]|uniref:RNase H type-1 domain-containing protein n=1 Tax=Digitaria exilis TaxID=1010633 RepID=A0A835EF23_9POAL|nr:hypothetical protein HU200_039978 [Digitaria exilis]